MRVVTGEPGELEIERRPSALEQALAEFRRPLDDLYQDEAVEFNFSEYEDDPLGFCEDVLGVNLWGGQKEVALAVRDNWKTFVRSGHSVGKTFVFACLVLWNLYARRGPVVTTGPSKESVQDLLWSEIHKLRSNAIEELPAQRTSLTGIHISEELYAKGKTSSKDAGGAGSQGKHHPRLMVLLDEAFGIDSLFWEPLISQASDPEGNRIAAVGNPTDPTSAAAVYDKSGNWERVRLSCLDHPNVVEGRQVIKGAVSASYVDAQKKKGQAIYYPRVLGEYPPEDASKVLAPREAVLACVRDEPDEDDLEAVSKFEAVRQEALEGDLVFGADIGTRQDSTAVSWAYGGWWIDKIELHEPGPGLDATWVEGHLAGLLRDHPGSHLTMDESHITMHDNLVSQDLPVTGVMFGQKAGFDDEDKRRYFDERARMLWALRERILEGSISLPSGRPARMLADELSTITWKQDARGRIRIEPKEKVKKRLGRSPDVTDAVALSLRPVEADDTDWSELIVA